MKRYFVALMLAASAQAAGKYTAERVSAYGAEIIRLTDGARAVQVSIAPSLGNRAIELKVHGKNILRFPEEVSSLTEKKAQQLNGIPFLAPWANRMAGGGFWAGEKRYLFNSEVGSVHPDAAGIAIHGMLSASPLWEVIGLGADAVSAHVTSRLRFWKYPDLMANWPFAHEYEMTYTLAEGFLEVTTKVVNLSAMPMPIVLGFHPYFNLPDVPRSEATVHIPAAKHVETDSRLVATGELTAVTLADSISLKDHTFDDGYTGLLRGSDGRAEFSVSGRGKKIEVLYGPKYQVAVIFAPPGQEFVCFEPMTAITNGANLAHDGKYAELQTVAAGATWQESFRVRWSGF